MTARILELKLRDPFGISRGTRTSVRNLFVNIGDGWGEGAPVYYKGQDVDTMLELALERVPTINPDAPIPDTMAALAEAHPDQSALLEAIDLALHDHWGKREGQPLWRLWNYDMKAAPRSTFTIGLDALDTVLEKVRRATEFPILKIKTGGENDMDLLRAIRNETDIPLLIDANEGWSVEQTLDWLPELSRIGVEMVEQPLPRADLDGYETLTSTNPTDIPIVIDEGVQGPEDVETWQGRADGINIKLAKCGGLHRAHQMIETARACGLRLMLGCMLESALAVSAGAHIAPMMEFVDLDGAELLATHPFDGMRLQQGTILLPDRPGLGALPTG